MGRDDIISRCDVEERHPGGDLLVRHFIGRDSSLEIEVYVLDSDLITN